MKEFFLIAQYYLSILRMKNELLSIILADVNDLISIKSETEVLKVEYQEIIDLIWGYCSKIKMVFRRSTICPRVGSVPISNWI